MTFMGCHDSSLLNSCSGLSACACASSSDCLSANGLMALSQTGLQAIEIKSHNNIRDCHALDDCAKAHVSSVNVI